MTTKLATLAAAFASSWVELERSTEDDPAWTLADDAPEWMKEIVRKAHADFFPDDWRYRFIRSVSLEIAEVLEYEPTADLDDARHERIDSLIPIYNMERVNWLASSLHRGGYVDDALENMGGHLNHEDGIFHLLAYGIDAELTEIWFAVEAGLKEQTDDEDEDGE